MLFPLISGVDTVEARVEAYCKLSKGTLLPMTGIGLKRLVPPVGKQVNSCGVLRSGRRLSEELAVPVAMGEGGTK